jgi:HEAT repeat protein
MKNPANLAVLQDAFNDPDSKNELKATCLLAIGLLGDERGAYTLYPILLSNFHEDIQAMAVAALAKLGKRELQLQWHGKSVTVDLVDRFERWLYMKRTKVKVRQALAIALGTMGRERTSLGALRKAVTLDRDRGVVVFSLLSMALMKKGEPGQMITRDLIYRVLSVNSDSVIRSFALLALGLSGDHETGEVLLNFFKRSRKPDVRAAAALSLGLLKYKPAMPELGEEIVNPKDGGDARGMACIALGMIGDPSVGDYLKAVLRDVEVPYLKWGACNGLGALGDPSAIPEILKWIGSLNRITREGAIYSLGAFRDDFAIPPLLERFELEKVASIRGAIIVTLGKMAGTSPGALALDGFGLHVNWLATLRMPTLDFLTR